MKTFSPLSRRAFSAIGSIAPMSGIRASHGVHYQPASFPGGKEAGGEGEVPRYCLMSFENSSTFENTGSSLHEIENPKVSLWPGRIGSKCGFSFRIFWMYGSSERLSA